MSRIFISSTQNEEEIARELAYRLDHEGLFPVVDFFEAELADEWLHHVLYSVESSDVVLLLMPEDDYERKWIPRELNKTLKYKLKSRSILLIPVYLGGNRFFAPSSGQVTFFLENESHSHSLKKYSERSIEKLVTYLANVPKIEFNALSPIEFEHLIITLLNKLRFFEIEKQRSSHNMGFDILAKTKTRNPFGGTSFVSWAIEIKYNKNSRADISSLKQLSYYLEDRSIDVNGVLITNGQLTSTALEWLEYNEKEKRTSITVVDGIKLKQLILKHPEIVDEFFGHRGVL
ncbi:restriction endonuclease [uncultured Gimesia sp.]|uniref:restriction endonuclease n=1 Tax=uncultured Gimesia sp. TaxID=1678688 RepID=UPI00262D2C20|nr:restriction endonuclease [uncultured Gimesia sp.]